MSNKDLIKQYVNTGVILNQYQLSTIPDALKKRYVDLQINGLDDGYRYKPLTHYELMSFNDEQLKRFFIVPRRADINDIYHEISNDDKKLRDVSLLIRPYISDFYFQNYLSIRTLFNMFSYAYPIEDLFAFYFRGKVSENLLLHINYIIGYSKIYDVINKLKEEGLMDKFILECNAKINLDNLKLKKHKDTKFFITEAMLNLKLLLTIENPKKVLEEYVGLDTLKNEIEYKKRVLGKKINKDISIVAKNPKEIIEIFNMMGYE